MLTIAKDLTPPFLLFGTAYLYSLFIKRDVKIFYQNNLKCKNTYKDGFIKERTISDLNDNLLKQWYYINGQLYKYVNNVKKSTYYYYKDTKFLKSKQINNDFTTYFDSKDRIIFREYKENKYFKEYHPDGKLHYHIDLSDKEPKAIEWIDKYGKSLIPPEIDVFLSYKICKVDIYDEKSDKKQYKYVIVKMLIDHNIRRLFTFNGFQEIRYYDPQIRFEECKVLSIFDEDNNEYDECYSFVHQSDKPFIYKKNQTIKPDHYDSNRLNTCSNGLHGYMSLEFCKDKLKNKLW